MSDDNVANADDVTETTQPVYQLSSEALERLMAQARQASTSQQSQPRHKFVRVGIERQYDFNMELLNIIRPIAEKAPEEEGVKQDLDRAVDLLAKRNELLIIADGDPSVFNFYDQHKKAEGTTDPILSAFLKKKEKEESSKPKPSTWKIRRYEPFPRVKVPFRVERAAWAPAPLNVVPQGFFQPRYETPQRFDYQSRMAPQEAIRSSPGPRQMCYRCGKFGHFARDCKPAGQP
ncbi:zinc knuckle [Ancylostoma caninum]|uniref:Zinc knuckle n=1 Tax=Ancylostoma caninum TaxID=29170 RepID=A0A368F5I1_ANCCA|nr:zinc knuckle [Ancylostoma caninum]